MPAIEKWTAGVVVGRGALTLKFIEGTDVHDRRIEELQVAACIVVFAGLSTTAQRAVSAGKHTFLKQGFHGYCGFKVTGYRTTQDRKHLPTCNIVD